MLSIFRRLTRNNHRSHAIEYMLIALLSFTAAIQTTIVVGAGRHAP